MTPIAYKLIFLGMLCCCCSCCSIPNQNIGIFVWIILSIDQLVKGKFEAKPLTWSHIHLEVLDLAIEDSDMCTCRTKVNSWVIHYGLLLWGWTKLSKVDICPLKLAYPLLNFKWPILKKKSEQLVESASFWV